MPRKSVWALRAALLYLLTGFTFGALLLANKGQPFWPLIWQLLPAHIEFLVFGWMVQLALAVAFWILPRLPRRSRGNETLAALSLLLLNAGVIFVALQGLFPLFLPVGRVCEGLSGVLFVMHAWQRIRPLYPS